MGSFKLKLVLYFALLALLPTAIAFYGFDTLAQRSETRRVDARLQAGLRGSLAAYGAQLDEEERVTRAVARTPELQRALRQGDEASAAEIVALNPNVTIRTSSFVVPGRIRRGAKRTIMVIDHGRLLGRLTVAVPLDDTLLRRVRSSLDPRDELVAVRNGKIVAGPHEGRTLALRPGRAARVHVGDTTYRGLATSPIAEAGGIEFAALTPQHAISVAARRSEQRVVIGLVLTLAIFALVTYLLARSVVRTLRGLSEAALAIAAGDFRKRVDVRGRDEFAQLGGAFNDMASELEQRLIELDAERHRLREATARFGEALAATHDVDQLLRVVVESAVEATGAYGGVVLGPRGELARAGDPEAGLQKLELPLTAGKQSFGRVVLAGPSFGDDDREAAATLVSQAVVALENARLHRIVERQAHVDALTELANRRALEETLRAELARAARFNGELCLVLADLDWFKNVNDLYGHPFGDVVLREFARVLRATVREIDVAGRWGGEEFALILPGTDAVGGAAVAERARAAIAAADIRSPDGERIVVTASFGVAAFPECRDVDALVAAADAALYAAKGEGKDRVGIGGTGSSLKG